MSILENRGSEASDLDQIRVLHVDDEPDFAELTSEFLQRENELFEVETTTTVQKGLRLLSENEFDCIISDYNMPGQNGIEFLKAVREEFDKLPFILFTGKGSEEVASQAISAGVTDYLQKSTGSDQSTILANRVRNAVERIRAKQSQQVMREQMEIILENTDSILFELNLDSGRVDRKGDFNSAFGYQPGDLPTWQDYLEQAVHPDDREKFRRFIHRLADGDQNSDELIYRTNPETGSVRWIRDTVYVEDESDENPRRAIGLAHDITEKKWKQEERERVISRATDAVVKVDASWQFTFVDDRAEEIYKMSEDYLLGREFWDVFSEALGTRFEEEYRRVMETRESTSFEEYYPELDGWFEINVYPEDDGGLSFYFRDISDRKKYQQTIERQRTFTRNALNALDDLFFAFDENGSFKRWNSRLNEVTGYTDEEIKSMHPTDFFQPEDVPLIADHIEECLETGEATVEVPIATKDGETIPYEFRVQRLTGQNTETNIVGIGRDITERKQRDDRLVGLSEMLAKYLEIGTRRRLCQTTVEAACERLRLPVTAIALYDDESGSLQPTAQTPTAQKQLDGTQLLQQDGVAWQAFASGEVVLRDASGLDCIDTTLSAPRVMALPLGKQGVLITVVSAPGGVTTDEQNYIRTIAGALHQAINRIEYEEQLHEQEQTLEQQNHRLNRLSQINDVIRNVQQTLIQASTRNEIIEDVTTLLGDIDRYAFAWLGEYDESDDVVHPLSWAEIDTEYIDTVSGRGNAEVHNLATEAVRSDDIVIEQNLLKQPEWEPERQYVLRHGFNSVAAVPVSQQGESYVLFLHGRTASEFEGPEQEVLAELGTAIGYGIQNVVQTEAMDSAKRIELDIRVEDPQFVCARLSKATGGQVTYKGGLFCEEDQFTAFLEVGTAADNDVVETVSQWEVIDSITELSQKDGVKVYQIRGPVPPMITTLRDVNGRLLSLVSMDGTCELSVELLPCTDVRTFVDQLEAKYSAVELVSRKNRPTRREPHNPLEVEIQNTLTDRQLEAIETAHYSGFYEWPRETTAEELAAALDISSSTYQYHLRAAERKVVETVLNDQSFVT